MKQNKKGEEKAFYSFFFIVVFSPPSLLNISLKVKIRIELHSTSDTFNGGIYSSSLLQLQKDILPLERNRKTNRKKILKNRLNIERDTKIERMGEEERKEQT
jgi:hypothetical protein